VKPTHTRVYVARLAGTGVFDPIGDPVGKVRDVVVLMRPKGNPLAVGLVVEVPGRKRVFVPLTRVTAIEPGAVIITGLLNVRRFSQRTSEVLAVAELLDRKVILTDGSGEALINDLAIEQLQTRVWEVTRLSLERLTGRTTLGIRRRGETLTVPTSAVIGLDTTQEGQSAATLLATYIGLKPADVAEALQDLGDDRRIEVAVEMDDEQLADVMEELPEDDQVAILGGLTPDRAADVLEFMEPDDAADLLGELPESQQTALLSLMEPSEADDVRRLLAYDDNTAGGLMTTEAVILAPEATIATALAHVRKEDLAPALASAVFVCRPPLETPTGRYIGVVHFQRLLREPPHQPIGLFVDTDAEAVGPDASLGEVTRLLATYDSLALPVIDEDKHLLGIVSVDDVLDHILPPDWRDLDMHDGEIRDDELTTEVDNV
jgi:CBS domain-containing protein/sporulation protein YlmC with PRC-barrel domain